MPTNVGGIDANEGGCQGLVLSWVRKYRQEGAMFWRLRASQRRVLMAWYQVLECALTETKYGLDSFKVASFPSLTLHGDTK